MSSASCSDSLGQPDCQAFADQPDEVITIASRVDDIVMADWG
jgi:hypothetical protein